MRTLCHFVAFLVGEGLKHQSIKAYLAGIRFANIAGLWQPFPQRGHAPFRVYAWGIKKRKALSGAPPKHRLPITISVLRSLKLVWLAANPHHPDCVMLWAAACIFVLFLQAGECTVPSQHAYDPRAHLSLLYIAFDSYTAPKVAFDSYTDPKVRLPSPKKE